MNNTLFDLYTDYLISSFGATTAATRLSELVEGQVSHDQVTRRLAGPKRGSADLWQRVKPQVRKMEREEGVMIIDDSIEEKPYTDQAQDQEMTTDHADRLARCK